MNPEIQVTHVNASLSKDEADVVAAFQKLCAKATVRQSFLVIPNIDKTAYVLKFGTTDITSTAVVGYTVWYAVRGMLVTAKVETPFDKTAPKRVHFFFVSGHTHTPDMPTLSVQEINTALSPAPRLRGDDVDAARSVASGRATFPGTHVVAVVADKDAEEAVDVDAEVPDGDF